MKNEIVQYFKKINSEYPNYYDNEDFSNLDANIKSYFNNYGIAPIVRTDKTDVSFFEKKFGFQLPDEITKYINIFWHPYISGYLLDSESIVLFSVLKKEGDSSNDVLFYKNGLMDLANHWAEDGDINKYVPIGWLGYSGSFVLYEVDTGKIFLEDRNADVDGVVEDKPIAHSIAELINNLRLEL